MVGNVSAEESFDKFCYIEEERVYGSDFGKDMYLYRYPKIFT